MNTFPDVRVGTYRTVGTVDSANGKGTENGPTEYRSKTGHRLVTDWSQIGHRKDTDWSQTGHRLVTAYKRGYKVVTDWSQPKKEVTKEVTKWSHSCSK